MGWETLVLNLKVESGELTGWIKFMLDTYLLLQDPLSIFSFATNDSDSSSCEEV